MGLFSIYCECYRYLVFAKKHGYIPIIDFQHCSSQYFKDERVYQDNVWEYFFEQPSNISIDEIPENSKIIVSGMEDLTDIPRLFDLDFYGIEEMRSLIDKKYGSYDLIKFSDECKKYLDTMYERTIGKEDNVLGIICRGTDYSSLRPKFHRIQPTTDEVIRKVKELYTKYNYKKIWLSTEDSDIYNKFKTEFGDIILDNFQYKFKSEKDKAILQYSKPERKNHFYNLGKEYLASMYILSKCKYIVGGITSGTTGCFMLSNGFRDQAYVYLWNLGRYKVYNKLNYKKFEKLFSVRNESYEDIKRKVITLLGAKIKIKAGKVKNKCKEYINPDKL